MSRIVFLDTETTGLALDDDIWEFAAIIRDPGQPDVQFQMFIEHDPEKAAYLPASFLADYRARYGNGVVLTQQEAVKEIAAITGNRAHIVGAVPNFDTERLAILLRRYGIEPGWHYHLIDIEALAVGFLAGRAFRGDLDAGLAMPDLPWNSDNLSRACGVEPPGEGERHTALGDARWARDLYDAITGGPS